MNRLVAMNVRQEFSSEHRFPGDDARIARTFAGRDRMLIRLGASGPEIWTGLGRQGQSTPRRKCSPWITKKADGPMRITYAPATRCRIQLRAHLLRPRPLRLFSIISILL